MSSPFKQDEFINSGSIEEYPYAYQTAINKPQRKVVDEGLEKLTYYLDQLFRIPGTNIRFGLDPIIGFLLPVAGDTLSTLMSIYIVLRSIRYGLPKIVIGRMIFNVAVDYLIGSISFFGDLADMIATWSKSRSTPATEAGNVIVIWLCGRTLVCTVPLPERKTSPVTECRFGSINWFTVNAISSVEKGVLSEK